MPRKPVGNLFLERAPLPETRSGRLGDLDPALGDRPQVFYEHPRGRLWRGDALLWLDTLEPGSVDLLFADPPYGLGKAGWDTFESHDAYVDWSVRWIEKASRALKADGSLYVCGFSEILADLRRPAARHFQGCRWLVWSYRNKANLSNDWGRSHESIIHFRKGRRASIRVDDVRVPYGGHTLRYPGRTQATSSQFGAGKPREGEWTPNPLGAKPRDVIEIPVTANGMPEKTPHPTQKPEELLRRLILASSAPGALVVDPFVGSGTTLVCAEQLGRRWEGCELSEEHCRWAVARLERVEPRPVADWIASDREVARRREGLR